MPLIDVGILLDIVSDSLVFTKETIRQFVVPKVGFNAVYRSKNNEFVGLFSSIPRVEERNQ